MAVTPDAFAMGVRVGMRRGEAEALVPTAVTLIADPGTEAVAFEPVALAIEAVVPAMEMAAPGLVYLSTAGAVRYYGSEETVVGRLVAAVESVAPGGRFGLADGPFAARMAAERAVDGPLLVADTAGFLAGIDVAALGVEELVATFRWLGIGTLGGLAALPRAAVASRFGPAGLEAHRIASGEDRTVHPRSIRDEVVVEERFDPPLDDFERAAFAARALAGRLLEAVAPSGAMPHRVEVEVEATSGMVRARTWRSAHPFAEVELAERVRWHRWGEQAESSSLDPKAPWPGRLPEPSPTLVPPEPRPFEIEWDGGFPVRVRLGSRWESVLGWAGPWRRTGRWWEGESAADRYQVVTSVGAFLCEVRDGRSWLVGVYD